MTYSSKTVLWYVHRIFPSSCIWNLYNPPRFQHQVEQLNLIFKLEFVALESSQIPFSPKYPPHTNWDFVLLEYHILVERICCCILVSSSHKFIHLTQRKYGHFVIEKHIYISLRGTLTHQILLWPTGIGPYVTTNFYISGAFHW